MALGQSAGILFRIKADGSQAQNELRSIVGQVSGLGDEFAAMAGPAGIAVAAIAAIGAAAVVAGAALVKLAFDASEYGSAIFDAKEKSGLAAETLSTLKVAADASGSSFEGITGSVSKFTVLLGQANQGNEKAIATLKQYGITARDVNGALEQAVAVIGKEKDETLQAAAAKDLFKDRTGAIIPVIKQMGGDLQKATADAKRLGLVLGEDDVKAADDLGDAFGVLSAQVKAGAARFALQYAPQITAAINTISKFLADNSGVWGTWGKAIYNAVSGAIGVVQTFGKIIDSTFIGITANLIQQQTGWNVWAGVARAAIAVVTFGLSEAFMMLVRIGEMLDANAKKGINATDAESARDSMSDVVNSASASVRRATFGAAAVVNVGGRGGGRGNGGGRTPRDTSADDAARAAEEARQKEVEAAELIVRNTLEIYKAGYDRRIALLEQSLQLGVITEIEKVRDVARIRQEAIQDEIRLNQELLKNSALNQDERLVIEQKLKVLTLELQTERIKGGTEINEQVQKEIKAKEALIEKEKELLEIERQRLRDKRNAAAQARIDEDREEQRRIKADKEKQFDLPQTWADFVAAVVRDAPTIAAVMQNVGDIFTSAFSGMANAIGGVVEQWVLMGSTGPAVMRKILASALASIAAEAAVRAIWELALGFATLFTNPSESAGHFIAAALFGSVAVGAGLAGRAVAGDAFKQQATAATGQTSAGRQNSGQGEGNSGGVYSGQEDMTIERGRNTPGRGLAVELIVRGKDAFADMFAFEIGKNGKLRSAIQDAAAA